MDALLELLGLFLDQRRCIDSYHVLMFLLAHIKAYIVRGHTQQTSSTLYSRFPNYPYVTVELLLGKNYAPVRIQSSFTLQHL